MREIPRGKVKAFRDLLNQQNLEAMARETANAAHVNARHRNGKFRQLKRLYGDYLYHQDRDKFMVDLREWIAAGEP